MLASRWPLVVAVTAPPLVLAGLGFTHPHHLDASTADWWMTLHIILLPIFVLLGVGHLLLLRGEHNVVAWIGRLAVLVYIAFYGALDAIAGIATGAIMVRSGAATDDERPEIRWLYDIGGDLGTPGAWAFLVASVATSIVLVRRRGRGAVPGAVLLISASVPFLDSHIYWPNGVVSMLVMAAGFGWLALLPVEDRSVPTASRAAVGGSR